MKKTACAALLLGSVFLGGWFAADLFRNTSPQTMLIQSGSTALRYILPFFLSAVCVLAGRMIRPNEALKESAVSRAAAAALSVASASCGFHMMIQLWEDREPDYGQHRMNLVHITGMRFVLGLCAVLLVVYAVWNVFFLCETGVQGHSMRLMVPGMAGSAAFFIYVFFIAFAQPVSVYRIGPTMEILSALSALLFTVALLRAAYRPDYSTALRSLFRSGCCAFLFCTCIGAPYAVWKFANGVETAVTPPFSLVLGLIGVLGAVYAWSAASQTE